MKRSGFSGMLRIVLGVAMFCVLWACNSSDNSASNTTGAGNELVWDNGNWNESNWQ